MIIVVATRLVTVQEMDGSEVEHSVPVWELSDGSLMYPDIEAVCCAQ